MAKRKHKARQLLLVSWNTIAGKVLLTVGAARAALSADEAEYIADHLLVGAEAITTAEADQGEIDSDLDQSLRDQLNSEVSAAMDAGCRVAPCPSPPAPLPGVPGRGEPEATARTGPAAPPSSSVPLGGTARLAEELGSARETLAEILASSPLAPQEDKPDARMTRLTPAFPGAVRADGQTQIKQAFEGPVAGFSSPPGLGPDFLIRGLCEHPTDPGKILVNGVAISLGHARQYEIALRFLIESQRAKAFGRDLQATVLTAEPPVDVPTLRAD